MRHDVNTYNTTCCMSLSLVQLVGGGEAHAEQGEERCGRGDEGAEGERG